MKWVLENNNNFAKSDSSTSFQPVWPTFGRLCEALLASSTAATCNTSVEQAAITQMPGFTLQRCVTFKYVLLLWKVVSGNSLKHFSCQLFYRMLQGLCSFHFCTAINAVVYFQCAISHLRPETNKGHLNSLLLTNSSFGQYGLITGVTISAI